MTVTPKEDRKVWATLVTKPDYVPGLVALHYTLLRVSRYPLIVMATPTLPESSRRIIQSRGMRVVDVDDLAPELGRHPGFEAKFLRFSDTWTKLRMFSLTEYDTVVMIDSDMIFTRGMDEIFDVQLPARDWIGAGPACVCNPFSIPHYPDDWVPANCTISQHGRYPAIDGPSIPDPNGPRTSHLLNSGLVLLHPSETIMKDLEHFLNTSDRVAHYKFPDQDLLAEFFEGRWKPLAWWANALKTERAVHADIWQDQEVRLIHYILEKPWHERPEFVKRFRAPENDLPPTPVSMDGKPRLPALLLDLVGSSPPQRSLTRYDEVHAWWWVIYEMVLEEMKADGDAEAVREVEAFVTR